AEVDQHGSAEDEVEGAEGFGRCVVDRHPDSLDRALQGLPSELESLSAPAVLRRAQAWRPVQLPGAVDVDRGHRRAPALELERPKALECADVQRPFPGEVVGEAVATDV